MEAVSEFFEMFRLAEGVQIGKDGIALHFARIAYLKMSGIRVHSLDFGPYFLR